MKHLFIVNPVAGGSDKTDLVSARVGQYFSAHKGEFEIYTTTAPMDAVSKIRKEAQLCDELRVYACGGDGTLNECVCAAAELDNVAVTVFPVGTGNDFVKMFGPESERFKDLGELVEGEVRDIDLIRCNDRYSLNICCTGIDARVGVDVHKYSKLPLIGGSTGYVTSAVVNMIKGITEPMRVSCNGKLYYGDMNLVCVCNGQYYGGGFHPVPEARPDDGVLDMLIIQGVSRPVFVKLLGQYAKGNYAKFPQYITHVQGTEMRIESEKEMVVAVDGECMRCKRLDIRLIPGGIRFVFPVNTAFFANAKEKIEV